MYMGDIQKNWVAPQNGPSKLKSFVQLKMFGGGQLG